MPETALRIGGEATKSLPRKINFNVGALASLKCPPGKDRVYTYDAKTPSLAYVVTENDARAFYFVKKYNGRAQRVRLGGAELSIELARKLAAKMSGEIAQGMDPLEAKRAVRASDTLQELFDHYTTDHAEARCTERTRISDKSRFNTCFEDWKTRKVLSIRGADVAALHTKIGRERGHVTANRAIKLLRRLLNWGRVKPNAVNKESITFFQEHSRERFLQPDELPRLFAAIDDPATNPLVKDFVYLCLWTGARRSNIASMRDEEINLHAGTWTIPGGKSKSKKQMDIPLSEPAMEIIKRRMGHESGFLFPGPGKKGHFVEPKATWKKIIERSKLTNVRLHDLRRTLGSWQAAGGASLQIIGRSLGHRDPNATLIYSRLDLAPVRASVNAATAAMLNAGKAMKKKKAK